MNGLQTLKQWNAAFNNPTGGMVCLCSVYLISPRHLTVFWHSSVSSIAFKPSVLSALLPSLPTPPMASDVVLPFSPVQPS